MPALRQGGSMEANQVIETADVLREWRSRILDGFLRIASIGASLATVVTALDASAHPKRWPAVAVFAALSVILICLAIFRKLDYRIRTWGMLAVAYIACLGTLITVGLGSTGRIYLLAIPILALILLGVREGLFAMGLSIFTLSLFTILMPSNSALQSQLVERNSFALQDWLAEGAD